VLLVRSGRAERSTALRSLPRPPAKPFIRRRKTARERRFRRGVIKRHTDGFNDARPLFFYPPAKHHRLRRRGLTNGCGLNRILAGNHRTAQQGWQT
jgi:hypothetical protein